MSFDFDLLAPLVLPFRILKAYGMWIEKDQKWFNLWRGILLHIVLIDVVIGLQSIFFFTFETFDELTQLLNILPSYLALAMKAANLMLKFRKIQSLLQMVDELLLECKNKKLLRRRLVTVDKMTRIYLGVALVSILMGTLETAVHLPFAMWFPWDKNNRFGYWVSAAYQMSMAFGGSFIVAVVDLLPAVFMSYAVGFIESLRLRLSSANETTMTEPPAKQNALDVTSAAEVSAKPGGSKISEFQLQNDVNDANYRELLMCIKFQIKIERFVEEIQETFSSMILVQSFISAVVLCTTSFLLIDVNFFKHFEG